MWCVGDPRRILQDMCIKNAEWDEPISDELRPRWECWQRDLLDLGNLKIQRWGGGGGG